MAEVGALAMGSSTYEWVLDHLEGATTWPYALPTWVFTSRRLGRPEGADVRFVSGEVAPVHADMVAAARGRNVWLVGGDELVGQFHDAAVRGAAPGPVGRLTCLTCLTCRQWNRRSLRLLVTTNSELRAMAAPAYSGLSSPDAASGIAATL